MVQYPAEHQTRRRRSGEDLCFLQNWLFHTTTKLTGHRQLYLDLTTRCLSAYLLLLPLLPELDNRLGHFVIQLLGWQRTNERTIDRSLYGNHNSFVLHVKMN